MGYINAVRRNFENSNLCESFYIVIVRLLPGKVVRSRTSGYRDTGTRTILNVQYPDIQYEYITVLYLCVAFFFLI